MVRKQQKSAEAEQPSDDDPIATEILAASCRGVAGISRHLSARLGARPEFCVADGARSVEVTCGKRVYVIGVRREK